MFLFVNCYVCITFHIILAKIILFNMTTCSATAESQLRMSTCLFVEKKYVR